jgi:uncharacterized delta-60 repeat protein
MAHVEGLECRRLLSGYDLLIASITTDVATVPLGGQVVGTAVLRNIGTVASPATTTVYYALTTRTATESDEGGGGGGGGGGGDGGGDGPGVVGRIGLVPIGAVAPGEERTVSLPLAVASALAPGNLFFSAVASELFIPDIRPTTEVEFGADDVDDSNNSRSREGTIAVVVPPPRLGSGDGGFGSGGTRSNTVQGPPLTIAGTVFDPPTGRQYAATTRIINDRPVLGLLRLNSDGSLDTTYGNGGLRLLPPGSPFATARAITRLADGKLMVIGETREKDVVLARFDANGEPDGSFGNGGVVVLQSTVFEALGDFRVVRVMPGPGGTTTVVANTGGSGRPSRVAVARFAGGQLDGSFGLGGVRVLQFGTSDTAIDARALADGRLVVVGQARLPATGTRAFVSLLNASGFDDTSFASAGRFVLTPESDFESFGSVALTPGGGFLVTGVRRLPASQSAVALTVKLTAAGKPDKFGTRGVVVTSLPGVAVSGGATVLATSEGGALLSVRTAADVASATARRFGVSLVRLQANGKPLTTFGDGGVVTVRPAPTAPAAEGESDFDQIAATSEGQLEDVGGGKVRLLATESSDDTQTVLTSTQLVADGVDVAVRSSSVVAGAVLSGKAGTIRLTLSNLGTLAATGKYPVTVSLLEDLEQSGQVAATVMQSVKLAPGASRAVTLRFKYPNLPEVKRYFVAADVGLPTGVSDVDTGNNRAAAGGSLNVGPAFSRLAITLAAPVTRLDAGSSALVRLTVSNSGNVPARGSVVATFLLADDGTGANATELLSTPVKLSVSHIKAGLLSLRGKVPEGLPPASGKFLVVRFSGELIGEEGIEVISSSPLGGG